MSVLDTLAAVVRGHLALAAGALSDLQPRSRGADTATHATT